MSKGLRVAIAGATGAVGEELMRLLAERELPVAELRLLASSRSAGTKLAFRGEPVTVAELDASAFEGIDLVFFSCGGSRSEEFIPAARAAGAVVIDNSSAFRLDPTVPLVIPEINPDDAASHTGLLAVPNCTTIVMLMAAAPLHREAGLRRAVVASYQAASGAGRQAIEEYRAQTRAEAAGEQPRAHVLPRVLHGNVIPHVDAFLPDGWTKEERKFENESRRILGHPTLGVAATCVRVPVPRAHAVAAALEFERPIAPERAREILESAPGVSVVDGGEPPDYPTPRDAAGRLDVLVGRIRRDPTCPSGLMLWSVGDQLLKGAAWNAVQIAELLVKRGLV